MAAHRRFPNRQRLIMYQQRRPSVFRDRSNPLEDLEEDEVFERYRFRPQNIMYNLSPLPNLARPTRRNHPLPPILQLFLCLWFSATGAMHLLIGDSISVSLSSAGRSIREVARGIAGLHTCRQFIKFSKDQTAQEVKRAMSSIAGFPNVLGCVDGIQIRIRKPTENEADFVNRKGYHSLNVQMCCDATFRVTSCVAGWPGSVHESRIFRAFVLNMKMVNMMGFSLGIRDTLVGPF